VLDVLGLDSLETLEFLVAVENRFGVQIADSELSLSLVDNLSALDEYLRQRQGQEETPKRDSLG
jgi:acyl carrier protein